MSKTNDTVSQVRQEILQSLKRITAANSPAIYAKLKTANGYNYIERKVVEKVVNTGLSIDEAVPHIEQELSDL